MKRNLRKPPTPKSTFEQLKARAALFMHSKLATFLTFGIAASTFAYAYQHWWLMDSSNVQASLLAAASTQQFKKLGAFPVKIPIIKYGFALDTFNVVQELIQKKQSISDILSLYNIPYTTIDEIAENAKGKFNFNSLQSGKSYTILTRENEKVADYFIYEPDQYKYVLVNLKSKEVKVVEQPSEMRVSVASGMVESSLWNTMVANGMSYELTDKMEDALAWSVDFHHIQPGDRFKLIYEEKFVNGKPADVGRVLGAYFHKKSEDKEYYAFYFDDKKHKGYFDAQGRPMKRTFLKSPVRFSHISSYYNLKRLHPILGYVRPHFGTDYAAPHGTPIMTIADGVITEAGYKGGNGNYVKVRHDNKYETQYLHMSRFAVKKGQHVMQGQTIGYVGSTGLATGPHVCFRLWKSGAQVNHLKESLCDLQPLEKSALDRFNRLKADIMKQLDEVPYHTVAELNKMRMKQDTLAKTNP